MALKDAFHQLVTLELVVGWLLLSLLCVGALWVDLRRNNEAIPGTMKLVWTLTTLYSGPLGLAVYWYSGRTQIAHDSFWRRGLRSVSHCYSGCGLGEVAGITIAAGILAASTPVVIAITFSLAYLAGMVLTIGPLMQDGVGFKEATMDAFYSETASITVMEIVAISVDIFLAGEATMGEPVFWASLIVSLTLGFIVTYPVNLGLIHFGVKEGMGNPAAMG